MRRHGGVDSRGGKFFLPKCSFGFLVFSWVATRSGKRRKVTKSSTAEHRLAVEGHVGNIMASKFVRHFKNIYKIKRTPGDVNRFEITLKTSTRQCIARNVGSLAVNRSNRTLLLGPFGGTTQTQKEFHTTSIKLDDIQTVKCPAFAESISEGDVRWEVEVGDAVSVDQVVAEIETDKTSVPVPSPANGTIVELLIPDGERVEAGMDLFKLKAGDAPAKPAAKKETPAAAPAAPAAAPPPSAPPTVAPPPSKPAAVAPASSVKPQKAMDINVIGGTRAETRVKMNRMRLRIATRLKEAQNTCAMLTTFNEIDMSYIMELRKTYQDQFQKKHGIKLGFMSAFLKASAYALQDQPVVNAVIDGNEMVYRDYIDISVAVASPKGLVVPVIRNIETMNYVHIEQTLVDLGEKARKGDLAIEDMDGGTFTVSNGGVFGSLMGTPIINPPQSAILGMHGTFPRPVAVAGKVEIRPMMYIALTYDHRLIDGKEAVTFLRKIKGAVEDPRVIFLDL